MSNNYIYVEKMLGKKVVGETASYRERPKNSEGTDKKYKDKIAHFSDKFFLFMGEFQYRI